MVTGIFEFASLSACSFFLGSFTSQVCPTCPPCHCATCPSLTCYPATWWPTALSAFFCLLLGFALGNFALRKPGWALEGVDPSQASTAVLARGQLEDLRQRRGA